MDFKDYYNILGVSPEADSKVIKKTYQTLAKKYHPDVNKGNKEAEQKFKEINEAYHAISDPAKRKKYDELRADYQAWQSRGSRDSYDWSAWQGSPGAGSNTSNTRTMTPEEFAEVFGGRGSSSRRGAGADDYSDFFSSIFGRGQSSEDDYFSEVRPRARAGRDIEGEISITLEEAYHGAKRLIDVGSKRIEAVIPKGVKNDNKIRLGGQGQAGSKGGKSGDLLLTIKVLPHQQFTRDGDDVSANLEIDFYTAVLGGEARVKTIGGEIIIKIPAGTQTGKSFRLKGKGMPVLNQSGQFGDFYAKVSIVLPEKLSDKEINTLKDLYSSRLGSKEG